MTSSLSFPEIYDYYQGVVYDRELFVGQIAKFLTQVGAKSILDCACGTGLPALDLRAHGFEVVCSDGDPGMLDQFRRNARRRNVSEQSLLARWHELPEILHEKYDYVMCRGNSLVYAASWGGLEKPPATGGELFRSLGAIASMVTEGGFLHVDLPAAPSLSEATYPAIEIAGYPVSLTEWVIGHELGRTWHQKIIIGGDEYEFTTNSAVVRVDAVRGMLRTLGFGEITPVVIVGERPSYTVLLARKDGP